MKKLYIGTRGSMLALWQAKHIQTRLQQIDPSLDIELKIIKTKGDKILDVPLAKIGGKGLFTKELDILLLNGDIDIAVHSLKDVPVEMDDALVLAAFTQREDVRDAFLSEKYASLKDLPEHALIGTTSLRRTMQLKRLRQDFRTQSLRGNVQTRLKRLQEGDFDAIILAMAGVNRLGLQGQITHIVPLSVDEMIPAMGQAVLGVACRKDSDCLRLLNALNHEPSYCEATCERAFVRVLEGGCQVPIGAHAQMRNDQLSLKVILGMGDGSSVLEGFKEGYSDNPEALGEALAKEMIAKGAKELLKKAEEMGFEHIL